MKSPSTATCVRTLRAERCNRREIAVFLKVSQHQISAALRDRTGATYIDPNGTPRYVCNGARVAL